MNASIPFSRWPLAAWLVAFFSPTAFFLLLVLADRFHVGPPSEQLVAWLFYLVPVTGLLVCAAVVWRSKQPVARRIGWTLFTLVAMLLQFGLILTIIMAATGFA